MTCTGGSEIWNISLTVETLRSNLTGVGNTRAVPVGKRVEALGTQVTMVQLPPGDAEHFCFYSQASIKVSCKDAYTMRAQLARNGS